ncbi:MAG: hypothetical protein SFV51_11380 [Bryobacteraceae bacterium]|nr:hypothetical protein [Bryobacteraceae bacterium]
MSSSTKLAWLGLNDIDVTDALSAFLSTGCVFYDFGAGAGYHSLMASRVAGPGGAVYSFESSPRHLSYLHNHIEMNRARNIRVFAMPEGGTHEWRLDTLALSRGLAPPDLVRIHAPGREVEVLRGCRALLAAAKPVVVLTVTPAANAAAERDSVHCSWLLRELGYRVTTKPGGEIVMVATP